MPDFDIFSRLAAALAIGLLVGIERGWKSRGAEDHKRAAGFRTFGLAALMGGISGVLSDEVGPQIIVASFLCFSAAFSLFAWLEARETGDLSVTSLLAGVSTYLLGTMAAVGNITVAIAVAVGMTGLLAMRQTLHAWLFRLTWEEIRAGLILMIMTFLLLPLLPDRPIDPWGTINLHEVWLLTILIALISFIGYAAVRAFGGTWGIIVTAAAGGLASSTATTLAFARLAREQPRAANLLTAGIFISGALMALRVGALVAVLDPALLARLMAGLGSVVVAMGVAAGVFLLLVQKTEPARGGPDLVIANPLALVTSLKMAAFITFVMAAVALVNEVWGHGGVLVVAGLAGVFDVDAITLSMARSDQPLQLASLAILLAVGVNTAAKAAIAAWVGGAVVGLRVGCGSAAVLGSMAATFLWRG